MSRRHWFAVVLVGAIWLVACSGGSSQPEGLPDPDLSNKTVRVVFDLAGDDIGGPDSQKTLQTIKDEILRKHVAKVVSSGFGMGTMEVVLKYEGAGSAEELRSLIARIYPQAKYRIESRRS